MSTEVKIGVFDDADQADRTVRWLRRSGLHARIEQDGQAFEVVVPAGPEEREARRVLEALQRTSKRELPSALSGWDRLRGRLLSWESVGMVVAALFGAVLLLLVAIWLWALAGMLGWLGLLAVLGAGLAYFHFSGIPHSAVKSPRRYSHKHDITIEQEQMVQYRLAWARDDYRKSRRSLFLRKRTKK